MMAATAMRVRRAGSLFIAWELLSTQLHAQNNCDKVGPKRAALRCQAEARFDTIGLCLKGTCEQEHPKDMFL
jgi:hypothetical protein